MVVFQRRPSNSKSPQLSWPLLSILPILTMLRSWFFFWFPTSPVSFQPFGDCSQCTNYNWYHRHLHVPQFFFKFSGKIQVLFIILLSLIVTLWPTGTLLLLLLLLWIYNSFYIYIYIYIMLFAYIWMYIYIYIYIYVSIVMRAYLRNF